MWQLRLARRGWVLDAIAEIRTIGRPDACPDTILFAGFQLGDDIGVGDMAAGHADKIDDFLADGIARGGKVIDAGGMKHGKPDRAPEPAGLFKEGRQRGRHARHVVCQPWQAVDAAGHKIKEIDGAVIAKL